MSQRSELLKHLACLKICPNPCKNLSVSHMSQIVPKEENDNNEKDSFISFKIKTKHNFTKKEKERMFSFHLILNRKIREDSI